MMLTNPCPTHAANVLRFDAEGMATPVAMLEASPPTWAIWDADHRPHDRFVAVDTGEVAGRVALSPVSGRCVYGGVAELSGYVSDAFWGRGMGLRLLEKRMDKSEKAGIWTLLASIDRSTWRAFAGTGGPNYAWWAPANGWSSASANGVTSG